MTTGVVIGKFYPPHRGHKFLIDFATSKVDRLFVIVCDQPDQLVRGELRGLWLEEIHPTVSVLVTPDDLPNEPLPWARRTIELLGAAPDIVFTSEDYGHSYAAAMGAEHVLVDIDRTQVPMSATKVRNSLLDCWAYLEPPVQQTLAFRIVLIGVESTGKTTLAHELADALKTVWVPEYGREYAEHKVASGQPWVTDDFVKIAKAQQDRENDFARKCSGVLICDTNAFATGVWHERYLGCRSEEVDEIGRRDTVDLYLLTMPDFPFVQDGTRDGEHIRGWMHERFVQRLDEQSAPVISLFGSIESRRDQALNAIRNRCKARGWTRSSQPSKVADDGASYPTGNT